jgi:hypothetical protein
MLCLLRILKSRFIFSYIQIHFFLTVAPSIPIAIGNSSKEKLFDVPFFVVISRYREKSMHCIVGNRQSGNGLCIDFSLSLEMTDRFRIKYISTK